MSVTQVSSSGGHTEYLFLFAHRRTSSPSTCSRGPKQIYVIELRSLGKNILFKRREKAKESMPYPSLLWFTKPKQLESVPTNLHPPQIQGIFSSTSLEKNGIKEQDELNLICTTYQKKQVKIVITRARRHVQTLRCASYLGFLQKKKKGLLENQAFGREQGQSRSHKLSASVPLQCLFAFKISVFNAVHSKCTSLSLISNNTDVTEVFLCIWNIFARLVKVIKRSRRSEEREGLFLLGLSGR